MSVQRGDVVIALFPHADGLSSKPRPVLVVQADTYNVRIQNVVVVAITTNLTHAADPACCLVDVATPDGKTSGLTRTLVISCINLATIEETRVAKKIGHLPLALIAKVNDCLKIVLGLP